MASVAAIPMLPATSCSAAHSGFAGHRHQPGVVPLSGMVLLFSGFFHALFAKLSRPVPRILLCRITHIHSLPTVLISTFRLREIVVLSDPIPAGELVVQEFVVHSSS
jgi:hypothetical protein